MLNILYDKSKEYKYVWFWRKSLPERKGCRCRIVSTVATCKVIVEFEDGYRTEVPLSAIRLPFKTIQLEDHIDRSGECWVWTGSTNSKGYGAICVDGKPEGVHRIMWQRMYGPIPDGLWVLHHCDHPACVNPHHLFLGTATDNEQDKIRKGRRCPDEKQSGAKLNPRLAYQIRQKYLGGGASFGCLAKEFSISVSVICGVVYNKKWKDSSYIPPTCPSVNIGRRNRKFTEMMIRTLRKLYVSGRTQKSLADEYGVGESTIGRIVRCEVYKHA